MILQRHIGKTIIAATLIVLVVLIGLQFFIGFIGQLDDLGQGHYGIFQTITYVCLTLPSHVYAFFPMIALLGSLLGLGYLASHSELIVMRASGFSLLQIIWSVMKAALLLLIVMTLIGEGIGPMATHWATFEKIEAKSNGNALNTQYGMWIKNDNNFIRIGKAQSGNALLDITQYRFDNHQRLMVASHADSASLKKGQWMLHNIRETHFLKNKTQLKMIQNTVWQVHFAPQLFHLSALDPSNMSLKQLYQVIHYQSASGLDIHNFLLVFWQRIIQPFATLIMIFLAIPFIFGPLRGVAMGLRIVTGVVVGFGFYLLHQFFGPFSMVYHIPAFIGASLPSLFFLILGLLLLRRVL